MLAWLLLALLAGRALADDYDTGLEAYRAEDFAAARTHFEAGAAAGDMRAQFALGLLYDTGRGLAKDLALARQWYEKDRKSTRLNSSHT